MEHPMLIGIAIGWLLSHYLDSVAVQIRKNLEIKKKKELESRGTVTVKLTKEEYEKFKTMPIGNKKIIGFASVLQSEGVEKKTEEET